MLNIGPLSSSAIQMLTLVHFTVSCCLSDYWFKSKVDCGWTFPFPQFRVCATNVGAISDLSHRHFSSVLSLMVCVFFFMWDLLTIRKIWTIDRGTLWGEPPSAQRESGQRRNCSPQSAQIFKHTPQLHAFQRRQLRLQKLLSGRQRADRSAFQPHGAS